MKRLLALFILAAAVASAQVTIAWEDIAKPAPLNGTSILAGNGAGGFTSVVVGGNLSFTGGTLNLSATPNIGAATGTSVLLNPLHAAVRRTEIQIPHTVSTEDFLRVSSLFSGQTYGAEYGYGLTAGGSPQIRINRLHAGASTPWLTVATLDGAGTIAGDLTLSGASRRLFLTDGTNTLTLGQHDGSTNRIESNGRDLYLTSYTNVIRAGGSGATWLTLNSAGLSLTGNLSLTGGSGQISVANNGVGLSVGTTRPFTYNGSGVAQIRGEAGNWAVRYGFAGSGGTARGGFGAYGTDDALGYLWIGTDHSNFFARIDSGQTQFTTPTLSVASSSVGLFRMDRVGVRQWNLTNDGNMVWSTGDGAGSFTFSNSAGVRITGTNSNDNAATGYVGEYVASTVAAGSAISLTNNTQTNAMSITLTAGDWNVFFFPTFSGAPTGTALTASASTISATLSGASFENARTPTMPTSGSDVSLAAPMLRVSIGSTTTVYGVVRANFTSGTASVYGQLQARRVR